MQDIKLLLSILSFLVSIILVLIGYIIKTKDSTEKATKETLKELKILVDDISKNVAILKLELENNVYNTRKHEDMLNKHTDIIYSIKTLGSRISGRLTIVERELQDLKKK